MIARFLATNHPNNKRLGPCFICGLLHEVGRLVIYQRLPELARAATLFASRENIPEAEAERQVIGFDHYQVGAELARRWRLPEVIIATIENHQYPETAKNFPLETGLVTLAYQLSIVDYHDKELLEAQFLADDFLWERIGLDGSILDKVLIEADQAFVEVFKQIFHD